MSKSGPFLFKEIDIAKKAKKRWYLFECFPASPDFTYVRLFPYDEQVWKGPYPPGSAEQPDLSDLASLPFHW